MCVCVCVCLTEVMFPTLKHTHKYKHILLDERLYITHIHPKIRIFREKFRFVYICVSTEIQWKVICTFWVCLYIHNFIIAKNGLNPK